MKKIYIVIWMLMLVGCAQTKYVVPNDTITQTKTQTKTIQRDSIYNYEKDSMAISWRSGAHVGSDPACYPARVDTIVIEKWHEHWKDRWLSRADTLLRCDTITITQTQTITEKERFVPGFYKWCTGLFWVIVAGVIVIIALKIWW